MKNFSFQKDTVKTRIIQIIDQKKTFIVDIAQKGLKLRLQRELLQLNNKKTTKLIKFIK